MTAIIDCLGGNWTPGFGDRGLQAWLTVLMYLACGFLAVAVWNRRTEPVLRRFWALVAMLMLFLAVNKQLDLQTAFTETGRCLSFAEGWYAYRRLVQLLFILFLGAAVLLMLFLGAQMMRGYLASHWPALGGTALVGAYVLIRAISFHVIDLASTRRVMGLSMNFILENAGLVLIALNAALLLSGRIIPRDNAAAHARSAQQGSGVRRAVLPPGPEAAIGDRAATEAHRFRPLAPRGD